MKHIYFSMTLSVATVLLCGSSRAAEPVTPLINLRNDGTGVYPDAKPPIEWAATTNAPKSVLWKTPLPGPVELSQPIIIGDRVIVMSAPMTLMCLDKMTGKLMWRQDTHALPNAVALTEEDKAFKLEQYLLYWWKNIFSKHQVDWCHQPSPTPLVDPSTRYDHFVGLGNVERATALGPSKVVVDHAPETWPNSNAEVVTGFAGLSTPTSDGKNVYADFVAGSVVSYDLDGKRRWMRLLLDENGNVPGPKQTSGSVRNEHGCGQNTSPFLLNGKLYVHRHGSQVVDTGKVQRTSQVMHCLDAETGKTIWAKTIPGRGWWGMNALEKGGVWYIATSSGAIFDESGNVIENAGWFGPGVAVNRADGIFYWLNKAVRVPGQRDGKVTDVWRMKDHEEAWFAQHVPDGQSPIPFDQRDKSTDRGQYPGPGRRGNVRNWARPVFCDGIFYHFSGEVKVLSATDVSTGTLNMHYAEPIPEFWQPKKKEPYVKGSQLYPPLGFTDLSLAGEYVFVTVWNRTAIIKKGKEFKLVGVCEHEPTLGSNLVFDQDRIYLRGLQNLWCIRGDKP